MIVPRIIVVVGIVIGTTVREKNSSEKKQRRASQCAALTHQYIGMRINAAMESGMVNTANTICAAAHPPTACLVPALHMMASAR